MSAIVTGAAVAVLVTSGLTAGVMVETAHLDDPYVAPMTHHGPPGPAQVELLEQGSEQPPVALVAIDALSAAGFDEAAAISDVCGIDSTASLGLDAALCALNQGTHRVLDAFNLLP
jgi:hypothetical protein